MVLGLLVYETPSNCEALVYKSYFFQNSWSCGNYSKLDSHTNTASRICLLGKMASKTVTRSIKGPISLNKIGAENEGGCIVYVAVKRCSTRPDFSAICKVSKISPQNVQPRPPGGGYSHIWAI